MHFLQDKSHFDGIPENRNPLQRVFGAVLYAFHAKDAFRSVLPAARIVGYVHIHGTYAPALPAMNTFVFVAFDADQREIAHRLQNNGDGADVFTKSPVIPEGKSKGDAHGVI